jgi:hypothetical protein
MFSTPLRAMLACAVFVVVAAGREYPISNGVPHCEDSTVQNKTLYYDMLIASPQMPAQEVELRVGVPFAPLVAFFDQPQYWPIWNHLFGTNYVTDYSLCAPFDNVTYTNPPPVSPPFPKSMTAPHFIDQHGYNFLGDTFAFGWIFQLVNQGEMLVYGRHTFTIRSNDGGKSAIAQSWEKAAGPQLAEPGNGAAWTIALEESLLDAVNGFVCLERVYTQTGALTIADVKASCTKFTP